MSAQREMEHPSRGVLEDFYTMGEQTSGQNTVQRTLIWSRIARLWRWLTSFLAGSAIVSESSDASERRRTIDRRVWVAEEAVRAAKKHRDDDPEKLVELFRETARLLCLEDRISITENGG